MEKLFEKTLYLSKKILSYFSGKFLIFSRIRILLYERFEMYLNVETSL